MLKFLSFLICFFVALEPLSASSPQKLRALYNSLEPSSVAEHLAFYELYPNSQEGQMALRQAWQLLSSHKNQQPVPMVDDLKLPSDFSSIIAIVNKQPLETTPQLNEKTLQIVQNLASGLPNRRLKGFNAATEEEVLTLKPEEIDVARALFLSQPETSDTKERYEAMLDLMALQISARLPDQATPEEKIKEMNRFIFEEMRFRFPPHALYAKNIDLYTFLPSVLDSHRGVCLGVSIMYICLAQRLDLNLEMITPPGHIFVRYRNGEKIINIETTARGVNLPTERYLGIETRSLQQRDLKEVIGLAHFNQASTYWEKEEYSKAIKAYEIAKKYLPEDKLLMELLGYAYLLAGEKKKGEALLRQVVGYIPPHSIARDTMVEDYFKGNVDAEGIKAFFIHVDEKRESILKKKEALEKALKSHPRFRNGHFGLAIAWLQLYREGEALGVLEKLYPLQPNDPTLEYYLATLYFQRKDYNKAWEHFKRLEIITLAVNHKPKIIKELRKALTAASPE